MQHPGSLQKEKRPITERKNMKGVVERKRPPAPVGHPERKKAVLKKGRENKSSLPGKKVGDAGSIEQRRGGTGRVPFLSNWKGHEDGREPENDARSEKELTKKVNYAI